jgi:tRNA pseudouridine38-40 synthase
MRIAIKLAYNGEKFYGFARQPKLKTVEGVLINKLKKNNVIINTKESIFRSASRTDKVVSSFGNVVAFNTILSQKEVLTKLSHKFDDVIIYAIGEVPLDFYPRYAKLRKYRYYLSTNGLETKNIIDAMSLFTGKHNFSNFARIEAGKNPVRIIENIVFENYENFFVIDFFAQTFLWNQIRRIVAAIVKFGEGKIEIDDIIEALEKPEKKVDFGVAPAKPLVLVDIFYDFDFYYDKKQVAKVNKLEKQIISEIKKL